MGIGAGFNESSFYAHPTPSPHGWEYSLSLGSSSKHWISTFNLENKQMSTSTQFLMLSFFPCLYTVLRCPPRAPKLDRFRNTSTAEVPSREHSDSGGRQAGCGFPVLPLTSCRKDATIPLSSPNHSPVDM